MEILFGASQGLILGQLSFNIFSTYLILIISKIDIASYVDDNASYIIADNINDLIKSLEEASTAFFQWFNNNLLKSHPCKCHLLISSNQNIRVKIGYPTNTPRVFHVITTWKRPFPRRFNVEYMWCVCGVT